MVHRLKVLGLVLTAMLALGVLSASAASAAEFFSSAEATEFEAGQEGVHELVTNTGVVTCEVVHFTGVQEGAVAETMTLSPSYSECEFEELFGITVSVNGCDYVFSAENETEGEAEIANCNESVPYIQWGSLATCRVRISQQVIPRVTYKRTFSNWFRREVIYEWVVIIYAESGLFCAGGPVNNGTYSGISQVVGNGESAELWIE